jgi:hypothetical protein
VGIWCTEVAAWLKEQWPEAVHLLVDHTPKGANGVADDPIGAQTKGGVADAMFNVYVTGKISRASHGGGRMVVRKSRDGYATDDTAVLDFTFGGGRPFEMSAPDPTKVDINLTRAGIDPDVVRRIAGYVGDHEGVRVETARRDLGIHPNEFTKMKTLLVSCGVLGHRKGLGLFKGVRWAAYMDGSFQITPVDG